MTTDSKARITKQGIRDLNFYGSRKKLAEAAVAGEPLEVIALADAGEPALPAPATVADAPMSGS